MRNEIAFIGSLAGERPSLGKEAGPELPFAKKVFFEGRIGQYAN